MKSFIDKTIKPVLADADFALSAKSFLLNPHFAEDVRAGKELPLYQSSDADVAYTDKPLP